MIAIDPTLAGTLLSDLPRVITAIGGLGTAAFGLLEAIKPLSGVNNIGFAGIRAAVLPLLPPPPAPANALTPGDAIGNLQSNWVNGTDLTSQMAIAKSLIKLNLNPGTAAALANATSVDPVALGAVATAMASGTPLTVAQSDVLARFDMIVTALLDKAYQRSDQFYRNWMRFLAMLIALVLAITAGVMLNGHSPESILESVLVGLLATPLAPIAKDISSALATAVNAMQAVRKQGS